MTVKIPNPFMQINEKPASVVAAPQKPAESDPSVTPDYAEAGGPSDVLEDYYTTPAPPNNVYAAPLFDLDAVMLGIEKSLNDEPKPLFLQQVTEDLQELMTLTEQPKIKP